MINRVIWLKHGRWYANQRYNSLRHVHKVTLLDGECFLIGRNKVNVNL